MTNVVSKTIHEHRVLPALEELTGEHLTVLATDDVLHDLLYRACPSFHDWLLQSVRAEIARRATGEDSRPPLMPNLLPHRELGMGLVAALRLMETASDALFESFAVSVLTIYVAACATRLLESAAAQAAMAAAPNN